MFENREFVLAIQQLPAWLNANFQFSTNYRFQVVLFGIGYYLTPLFIMFFGYVRLKNNTAVRNFYLISSGLNCLLLSAMIGETSLTISLILLQISILYSKSELDSKSCILLIGCTLVLLKSYNSVIFFIPGVLYLLWKSFQISTKLFQKFSLVVAGAISVGTFLQMTIDYLNTPLKLNTQNATSLSSLIAHPGFSRYFFVLLFTIFFAILLRRLYVFLAFPLIILIFVFLSYSSYFQVSPGFHYLIRIWGALVLAFFFYMYLFISAGILSNKRFKFPVFFFSILLINLLALNLNTSNGWNNYLRKMQVVIGSQQGLLPYNVLETDNMTDQKYSWPWSIPSTSFILQKNPSAGLIDNPTDFYYRPLDPNSMPSHNGFYWRD
jgi:hypothetical protein